MSKIHRAGITAMDMATDMATAMDMVTDMATAMDMATLISHNPPIADLKWSR